MTEKPTYKALAKRVSELEKESIERKLAQEALLESEEKYRAVVEQSLQGIVIMQDNSIVFTNKTFTEMSGYTAEELTSFPPERVTALVHPDDQQLVWGRFKERLEGKAVPQHYEFRGIRKDGSERWFEMYASLMKYDGRPSIQGIFIDISQRKLAERLLRENNEKYMTILDNIEDGYFEVDLAGNFTFFNNSVCEILGYPRDELLGMNNRQYTDEDNAKELYKIFNKVYTTGQPKKGFDWEIIRKNGTKRHLDASVSLIKNATGDGVGFRGIARDITDRKRTEEALRESEEKYRTLYDESKRAEGFYHSLLETSADAIVIYDMEGKVKYINPSFSKIFGWTMEELEGKRIPFVPESEREATMAGIKIIMGEGKAIQGFETKRYTKDRRLIDVNISGSRYEGHEGKPAGLLVFLRDTSERKKLEAQLQQAQKMEAIGTLAGGIAHDFNNILSAIMGYAELSMLDIAERSSTMDNLNEILTASRRARDMVKQILAFSRQNQQERIPIQISPIVKEALKMLRGSLPATIEIRQHIDNGTGVVEADATQIHQVLMNLSTNAAQAMSETGGILTIDLANVEVDGAEAARHADLKQGSYVRLTVSDTGEGMTQEVVERIFEPYFTTKEKDIGTGMGLAVVHGIVKAHGGAITVESEPGEGATLSVYLPIIEKEIRPEAMMTEVLATGHERVLFVDDEQALVDIGRRMLEKLGYQVTTRVSSVEALELFRAKPDQFDLVVTDMTMPNMTGDRLAKELMQIRADIPIVLCTGYSERMAKESAETIGIREFIMKPLAMKEFADAIRNAIDEV